MENVELTRVYRDRTAQVSRVCLPKDLEQNPLAQIRREYQAASARAHNPRTTRRDGLRGSGRISWPGCRFDDAPIELREHTEPTGPVPSACRCLTLGFRVPAAGRHRLFFCTRCTGPDRAPVVSSEFRLGPGVTLHHGLRIGASIRQAFRRRNGGSAAATWYARILLRSIAFCLPAGAAGPSSPRASDPAGWNRNGDRVASSTATLA
jgi:hypothetical protein